NRTFIFKVNEDFSPLIRYAQLRLSAQRNCSRHRAALRIDSGRVFAITVKSKNAFACRVVDDGIGVLPNLHLIQNFEGLQIENRDGRVSAVGYEPFAELRSDGYAMYSRSVWNVTH